jgi:hypothetical protein
MAWVTKTVRHNYRFYTGPAGAVGAALGTPVAGGVDFSLNVEIETDQECKIRTYKTIPIAIAGVGVRVLGPPALQELKTFTDKKGCEDSQGRKDYWDKLVIDATWRIESTVPIPLWTPFTGFITIPNPFVSGKDIQLESEIYPDGTGEPSKRLQCWVDGVHQYSHT